MWEATITVFGYTRCGKSQLINSYIYNEFSEEYEPTIEELYQCETRIDGSYALLKILDTQGCDQFNELRSTYIQNSDAFVLLYDVTNSNTVPILTEIAQSIKSLKSKSAPIIIAGTKSDLLNPTSKNSGATKMALKLAHNLNIPHVLVSSKDVQNVREVFGTAAINLKPEDLSPSGHVSSHKSSSETIETWLYSKPELLKPEKTTNEHHYPSLKKSALKLKKSISKLRHSKSVRTIKNAVSSSSLRVNNRPLNDVVIPLNREQENYNSLYPVNFDVLDRKPAIVDVEPKTSRCTIM